jgi:hypothetical protein
MLVCTVELMGWLELIRQDNLYLFVHMRTCWGKCGVLLDRRTKTWVKQLVATMTVPRRNTSGFLYLELLVVAFLKMIFL